MLWIIIGGVFFGGVHDFGALFASVRHGGKTPPMMIHSTQGSQPKPSFKAEMGPVMGPAPAMDEKWWPIRMGALAGT